MMLISKYITDLLVINNIIPTEKKEVYLYHIYIKLSKFAFIIISLLISYVYFDIINSLIFLYIFLRLRSLSGGFHLNNSFLCFISSILLVISGNILATNIINIFDSFLSRTMLFLLVLIICHISVSIAPINHPNLKLTLKEALALKQKLKIVIIRISIISTILLIFNSDYFIIIQTAITFNFSLMIVAKVFRQETKLIIK